MPNPISNLEVKINNNNLNKKINLHNEFKVFEHTVETQNFLRSSKEAQTGTSSPIPTVEEYAKSPVTVTLSNTLQKLTEKNVIFDRLKIDPNTLNKNSVNANESPYLSPHSFLLKYGYDIIKKIGDGTFSKVYSATHILSNRTVAIKSLDKKKIIQNYALTERVFREITLLKSINHKNICQLLQLIDSPQYIHMVLEYESGGELYEEIVKKTRLPPEECQVYFKQLISAMDYCHNLGIVHRDLKPENVLLDKNKKNVKIIDFGFSNLIKDNSYKLGTFCGSIAYAAPEVLSSKKYDGKKADIWSLGVMLYVMLVGQVPFKSRHVKILYESIVNKEYNIPDYVPKDAKDLIEKMLVLEPEKRIEMNDILSHPWITNPIVTRRTSSGIGLMNIYDVKLANDENEIIDRIIEICKNNNISENKINLQEDSFGMEQHSFDSPEFRESIINCISLDEPSSIKALYFLLKEEKAEKLEKQMSKTWKLNTLEVAKENDVTVYESICENDNENDELSTQEKEIQKKENERMQNFIHNRQFNRRSSTNLFTPTSTTQTLQGRNLSQTQLQGSEFIPRTPIDDHTTFMLLNGKYSKLTSDKYLSAANEEEQLNSAYKTYGSNDRDRDHDHDHDTYSKHGDTPAILTADMNHHDTVNTTAAVASTAFLSPPVGEMNTPISAPPFQDNTKHVYEIPSSLHNPPKNETLLEQIRRVKFNNNQPISAPVERTHYQPYFASFNYGIKNVNNGGDLNQRVEDSMFKVQSNALFPPQLSKITCSTFQEFSSAICHYLKSRNIQYSESVNYEGDESDVYHSYTSIDPSKEETEEKDEDKEDPLLVHEKSEVTGSNDAMELSLQNRPIRTLVIDCYLKLEDDQPNGSQEDLTSLLDSEGPTEAMEFLIEELSKQDRLADGIHFQMTIENISMGNGSNNSNSNSPRTLYVRTLLDPTGVGPKEEKIFNEFIQDLVLSLQ